MIAVDWGTSSFRAWRLAADGSVIAQRQSTDGLLACGGAFEDVLVRQLDGWHDDSVLMCGMVGSRNGWREVPYVDAPAGAKTIAAALCPVEAPRLAPRRVLIVPGLCQRGTPPDVMRGEETQLVGLFAQLPGGAHTVCLPGTHSKWVQAADGRIEHFRTAMTGELYALLRRHSLLAALLPPVADDDTDDADAFAKGVAASAAPGPLASRLFGVRTLGLFGSLRGECAASYLSGLLIGDELRGLCPEAAEFVHLIGQPALVARYARALALLGRRAQVHPETLAAAGLHRLALLAGL